MSRSKALSASCACLFALLPTLCTAAAADDDESRALDSKPMTPYQGPGTPRYLKDEKQVTQGAISVGGRKMAYQAEAGVQVVYLKDPQDEDPPLPHIDRTGPPPPVPPHASMSYVAYFRGDRADPLRPITFLYNGGPGSSTVWLHMGAFGPKRVLTADDTHSPAAPYRLVDNQYRCRCERSRLHRCAGNGLRAPSRRG